MMSHYHTGEYEIRKAEQKGSDLKKFEFKTRKLKALFMIKLFTNTNMTEAEKRQSLNFEQAANLGQAHEECGGVKYVVSAKINPPETMQSRHSIKTNFKYQKPLAELKIGTRRKTSTNVTFKQEAQRN